jgi:hypothetical protein
MNDFSSTSNSGLLKADYEPMPSKDSDLIDMVRKKRRKMADSRLGIKDQFPRDMNEEDKVMFGQSQG